MVLNNQNSKKISGLSLFFKNNINVNYHHTEDDLIVPTQTRDNINIARYLRRDENLKILDSVFTQLNVQYKTFFNNHSFKLLKQYKTVKPRLVKRLYNFKVNYQPKKKGLFDLKDFYMTFLDSQKLRHKNIFCMTDEQIDELGNENAYVHFIVNKIDGKSFYNFISTNKITVHIDDLIREKGKIAEEKLFSPVIRIYEWEYNVYYVFSFTTFMRENKINQSIESKIFSEFTELRNTNFILTENDCVPVNDHGGERDIADIDELEDGSYALNMNSLYSICNDGEVFFYGGLKFAN